MEVLGMKAVVYTKFGGPEVLKLKEVEKPTPKENEVLIRVHATSVKYGDLVARNFKNIPLRNFHMPAPMVFPMKFLFGISKPRITILGSEFSGEIVSVGKKVTKFKNGDQVFGYIGSPMGANAEYMCMPEDKMIGLKPDNMTHEEATCIPYGAIMATTHLKRVDIKKGKKVLINGASGGIGSAAVQLAKHYGAEVTGVCGTPRMEFVRSLGADHVIDYTKEDFTQTGKTYDVIYDILGKSTFSKCKNSLKKGGVYLNASFKMRKVFQMLITKFGGSKKVICVIGNEDPKDMPTFRKLAEDGKLRTIVDRTFSLEDTEEAHRYLESGQHKGNVVISIIPTKT
jgi:NADPH:quinone reductase-like Zn-dependent oxidoreductase